MIFSRVRSLALRGAALAVLLASTGCVSLLPPIETGTINEPSADGRFRGYWAKIRLDHPRVTVHVTPPLPAGTEEPPRTEARLKTVADWSAAQHATLAVNANFFAKVIPPETNKADEGWLPGLPVDIVGLSVSDGRVVSPPRVIAEQGDPALLLRRGEARIAYVGPGEFAGWRNAVAGIGPSDNGKQPGTLLVTDGRNTGATARVQPNVRHPRTAAGVTADGRTLILVVVDGRQPGYSAGATLYEMGELMLALGAANAVNLDGGGSSSFIYHPADAPEITNRPSGGTWRPVANALGIWVRAK